MKFSRELLQEKAGMKIDEPSSEGGTTSTGNIARSCFMNKNNFFKGLSKNNFSMLFSLVDGENRCQRRESVFFAKEF